MEDKIIIDIIPLSKDLLVQSDIIEYGRKCGITNVEKWTRYYIYGNIKNDIDRIIETLHDSVSDKYEIYYEYPRMKNVYEVGVLPGVMDPVSLTLKSLLEEMKIEVSDVFTSRVYKIEPTICEDIKRFLYNPLIEKFIEDYPKTVRMRFDKDRIKGIGSKLEGDIYEICRSLSLNDKEIAVIKSYFEKEGRDPTLIELETIAQTWSEHCQHKTLKGDVEFNDEYITGLLQSTIVKATEEINKDWCVSVFKDNAGIIEFDNEYNVCFKVETHNHPSALEPYGGAGTGIGGVIRDILGSGLGAKPVANTDIFCFAPPDIDNIPKGTLDPTIIIKGVVSGVRDYGNRVGIPTVNGAVYFHKSYVGNPLVYAGCVGIQRKEFSFKEAKTGDMVVAIGGKTGRDGIHGATFSSASLDEESESVSSSSVQIGNPIEEKKLIDAILEAQQQKLYNAITDCGAGGFSSAVGEMGEDIGVKVYLEKVPLKYEGLSPEEIWISESQERMVIAVPSENINKVREIMDKHDVEMSVIGEFTNTKRLELFYDGIKLGDLDMHFLHKGYPKSVKKAVYEEKGDKKEPFIINRDKYNDEYYFIKESLHRMFSHRDVASKEWITRQYDHEVQGGSVIKPLMGEYYRPCPSDGAVIRPILDREKGIVIANGFNPRFADISPYYMAKASVDEAIRNNVAVGGNIDHMAILDNYSWGNPEREEVMGDLVAASKGAYEAAVLYQTPFISGKDSLYNEYVYEGKEINILPTLVISSISVIDNVKNAIRPGFQKEGDLICITGFTYDELKGSLLSEVMMASGGAIPDLRSDAPDRFKRFYQLSQKGLVKSAHDCSEGGLIVSLIEMGFCKGLGALIDIDKIPIDGINDIIQILFSESLSRILFTIDKENLDKVKEIMQDKFAVIGEVKGNDIVVKDYVFPVEEYHKIWRKGIWQ